MADHHYIDDFEELDQQLPEQEETVSLPDDAEEQDNLQEEMHVRTVRAPKPEPKKAAKPLSPHAAQKAAAEQRKTVRTVLIVVGSFLALLLVLLAIGVAMSQRAGTLTPSSNTQQVEEDRSSKAVKAEGKTYFKNEGNKPELSDEGVKALITEAYYTVEGDLAVTLSLSNGTETDKTLNRLKIRVFNDKNETIAEQGFDTFDPPVRVPAGQYTSAYFVINAAYVALRDDSLKSIGSTIEIEAATIE
ncbi:MAG: DUF3157 family protein [Clostridia bacterium]|nr:DUF3157 family protein [Clostridia bacterium]